MWELLEDQIKFCDFAFARNFANLKNKPQAAEFSIKVLGIRGFSKQPLYIFLY